MFVLMAFMKVAFFMEHVFLIIIKLQNLLVKQIFMKN